MSTTEDTYGQALEAVRGALDALTESKREASAALDMDRVGYDQYDAERHSRATHEYIGACDAYFVVMRMIRDYRRAASA